MSAFEVLSPHDFEKLVRDLLQAEWGVRLESFSPGKDGGTDLRLLRRSELRTIQCKHHPNATLSSVQSKLRVEAKKLTGRKLGEYWIATSARATPASKNTTAEIFAAQGLRPERILAEEDIKNLLTDHVAVHRAHMKLYLSDITALQTVLNNAIHSRQEFLDDRIMKQLKYFVASDAVAEVDRVLLSAGACIVTGPPGVGKTSLAESIAAAHALDGYEIFEVFSAREVEQVWKKEAKQLFLYDDFLGQTGLVEKLDRGEDRSLNHLFKRVSMSGTHKIILTTREYILTAARGVYSTLNGEPFVQTNVVVDIGTYSDFQKAHILYNHLYYSQLGVAARKSVQRDENYLKAVRHVNYNPRLIESIIDAAVAAGGESAADRFAQFFLQSFNSPGDLWRDVFQVELSDSQRAIALLAGTSSFSEDREKLLVNADRFLEEQGSVSRVSLRDLDVLEGIFLDIDVDQRSRHVIRPKNPGIRDFLVGRLANETKNLAAYLSIASPRALSDLITLFSTRDATASRPWKEASKPDQEATVAVMAIHLPRVLGVLNNAQYLGRAVADLCNIFEQSTRGLIATDRAHLVTALRRAVSVSSASDVTAAYIVLLAHMSEEDSRTILEDIRNSWGDDMDIEDIPAALELERAVDGDLVADLEYRLLSNISYALDDYANLGFASRSEMLDVVSGYLDWVEGDHGDIPDRIEEMRRAEWEPDDDEYDRYRETRDASEGSVSDIHSLFGSLT